MKGTFKGDLKGSDLKVTLRVPLRVPLSSPSIEGVGPISIRAAALVAFDFQENELSSDLILSQAAVLARGWDDHQEQPVDQNAPEADRRNVPEEISDSEVDRESTIGGWANCDAYSQPYQSTCCSNTSLEEEPSPGPSRRDSHTRHEQLVA